MRTGWIMLIVLLCAAFLISCGKKEDGTTQRGELVRAEVWEIFPGTFACLALRESVWQPL